MDNFLFNSAAIIDPATLFVKALSAKPEGAFNLHGLTSGGRFIGFSAFARKVTLCLCNCLADGVRLSQAQRVGVRLTDGTGL